MTIYVDAAIWRIGNKFRAHMTATTIPELHEFARNLGVASCWFEKPRRHPHYDITPDQREEAIRRGAVKVDSRELLQIAKDSRQHKP